ncbi:reverse transcriptase domain-containing protein [Lacipirellula limnantheis]|uniref:Reverse transcriptase (RNA-dependent DNA polymerase) n=1 Tax=Lacipirellula limnantheis TaxID=2528024 RepID=A0A517U1H2_9BACT|nr:reverse transcriptase domain-containing protein [Lacipirellula limnantheis]QDT74470.1 Reverse transcriptase (RNA-dependent DNA polymerase) [Lacipirellula limnantheis]
MSIHYSFRKVTAHTGSARNFLERYCLAAIANRGRLGRLDPEFSAALMTYIADERNLRLALEHVEQAGGPSVGVDGLRARDLSRQEQWELIRQTSQQLLAGTYRRGELLPKQVPKRPGSTQTRTIHLQTLTDRMVARGVVQIVQPLLNEKADRLSFCRFGRGPQLAIAKASQLLAQEHRTTWIVEDLANAFDNVPQARLGQILRSQLPNEEVCELALQMVNAPSRRGILQGSALSPLLLNVYLDHVIHLPWQRRFPEVPLLRYVDDLLIAARPEDAAPELYAELRRLAVAAGFALKRGEAQAVSDLSRHEATWLGYAVGLNEGGVSLRVRSFDACDPAELAANRAQLLAAFVRLHARPHSWQYVPAVLQGKLERLAPTFPHVDVRSISQRLVAAAEAAGFDVLGGAEAQVQQWESAYRRYQQMAERIDLRLADVAPQAMTTGPDEWGPDDVPF